MRRNEFYSHLRRSSSGVFSGSFNQKQVDAMEALLDECERVQLTTPLAAHVFAEVYHETGGYMFPIKETVHPHHKNKNPTDKTVIARLDRAYAAGKLPWVKKPYWRDGAFGRGGIQITHWDNYIKLSPYVGVDLRKNPDMALDPVISAKIAVIGCAKGLFTGKNLDDFAGIPFDHYNARSIVNGDKNKTVKGEGKMGDRIRRLAFAFEDALKVSGYGPETRSAPTPPLPPDVEPVPNIDQNSRPKRKWWKLWRR